MWWGVSVGQSETSNTSVCSYCSFDVTVCCCLVVVLSGVSSFAPSWFTAAVHLFVCLLGFHLQLLLYVHFGEEKKTFWIKFSFNKPILVQYSKWSADGNMASPSGQKLRSCDSTPASLGDRMSKPGWIPSLLVIQSWHSFCASLTCEAVQTRNTLTEHLQFLYSRSRQPITAYLGENGGKHTSIAHCEWPRKDVIDILYCNILELL